MLLKQQKWYKYKRDAKVSDVVLRKDETTAGQTYKYARIVNIHFGTDGKVRAADVSYKVHGESKFRVSTRPIHIFVLVVTVEEQTMEEAEEHDDQEYKEEEWEEEGQRGPCPPEAEDETGGVQKPKELHEDSDKNEKVNRKEEPELPATSPPSIPRITYQEAEEDVKDVGQAVRKKRGQPRKNGTQAEERQQKAICPGPSKGSVLDRGVRECMDPEGNGFN